MGYGLAFGDEDRQLVKVFSYEDFSGGVGFGGGNGDQEGDRDGDKDGVLGFRFFRALFSCESLLLREEGRTKKRKQKSFAHTQKIHQFVERDKRQC